MSKKGKRPPEYASKASHGYVIKDEAVDSFLKECDLPKKAKDVAIDESLINKIEDLKVNPIKHIIAIDGGYNEVTVQKEFPSATICFFQFGALFFHIEDLENLARKPFIDPEDMQKLKDIQRKKIAIPTRNITYKQQHDLISSVRKTIFDFFRKETDDKSFMETLRWFLFEEYSPKPKSEWYLSSCPGGSSDTHPIVLRKNELKDDRVICPTCSSIVYLTDVFRLHEAIDNELGAGGVLGYLMTALEHILLIHVIRVILKTKPSLLNEILFIKDGPLGFFGQTARMHEPMRNLTNHLFANYNLFLVGLEKSGAFVEHAHEIEKNMKPGEALLLNNKYIYTYIIPGRADDKNPYASTSYYSAKLFYRSSDDRMYVITVPVKDKDVVLHPQKSDYQNLDVILKNIEKLKCDMYDDSIVPVALANKLVSLSNHPSTVILEKFAKKGVVK